MKMIWCVELAADITAILEEGDDPVEAGGKIVEYLQGKQKGGLWVCDNESTANK